MEKLIYILLAEDDVIDAIHLQRTLDKMHLTYHLDVVRNGEEALSLLHESDAGYFDILLVDINMPKMSGIEFLQRLRQDEKCKHLKCFIITNSDEQQDRTMAETLGVSGYIVKPLKLNNSASIDSFNLMIDLLNLKQERST